ncbi:DUF2690 domain-containing protein [Nocardioides sp.]|uniref:DUF2690 domain-containing protein n=1 Tax=Nocardioides sp. TaxID=35761 RepID=UPI0039E24D67
MTVAAVVSIGAVFSQAPSASAATGCVGTSCTGKDPDRQGCSSDARTVASFRAEFSSGLGSGILVELRHSNKCKSKWIRFKSQTSDIGCGGGTPGQVRIRNLRASGAVIAKEQRQFDIAKNCRKRMWTKMVGRTGKSFRVGFCFRMGTYGKPDFSGPWGYDSTYAPCVKKKW